MVLMPATSTVEPVLARWLDGQDRSVLREMIGVVSRPGILSLAGGLPASELFPTVEYGAAVQRVLASDPRALQYGPPVPALKEQVVEIMARRGVGCRPEQVCITTGAQQGLDILARVLVDPGRQVAVEELTFTGIGQVLAPRQAELVTLPTDLDTGLDVDALAERLEAGDPPAFLYVIPDGHNPLGVSLSPAKRRRLVELARRHRMPIVEDDPYALLGYDGELPPPLRALEESWVLYVGSFSKILAPGLRLGWIVAPEPLLKGIGLAKEASDLESSSLTQRAVAEYLEWNDLDSHLDTLRTHYRERRDALLCALADHFPAAATWTRPRGGMFVWVELPASVDCAALLERAVSQERVAFIPGHAFDVRFGLPAQERRGRNCMRLSFSTCSPARIEEGVKKLAALLNQEDL